MQHAHNPVDWFAWTQAAFLKAKELNRPIFLSIGYSTCHWCHVMEKESFENLEIAKILNKNFISIKVDREQRPDIDALYMKTAVLINGSGGWPLNVFITPEGEFFYGASYFPADKFKQILLKISSLWKNDQHRVINMAKSITEILNQQQVDLSSELVSKQVFTAAKVIDYVNNTVENYLKRFDSLQGGFSQAPKFPNEAILFFLMDSLLVDSNAGHFRPELFNAIETTLNAMANGGIYDHIGGGFHRYSVDNNWFAPHFEKMLYNQAHLSMIYLQFYQLSGQLEYKQIAKYIIDYVIRDMQHKIDFSAFYSASDADSKASIDSEAEEGLFYLWTINQLQTALSEKEFQLLSKLYNFTQQGNFVEAGIAKNILFRDETLTEYASSHHLAVGSLISRVNKITEKLYRLRANRISPAIDKKIVTSWNAMMISAFINAAKVFENKDYLNYAISAANYLNKYNYDHAQDLLMRSSINTRANILATQEDYAYFANALIDLYDQTANSLWLQQAEQLTDQMIDLFWDKNAAAFFQNNPLNEVKISNRLKDIYDGAIPSGNSIAMQVLARLSKRTTDQSKKIKYIALSDQMLAYYSATKPSFTRMPYLLMAVNQYKNGNNTLLQYGANGNLKAQLIKIDKAENNVENKAAYKINISISPGWHINSHTPIQEKLIKTSISLADSDSSIKNINYPKAKIKKLGFSNTKLSLYEKKLSINFKIEGQKPSIKNIIQVKLNFQACSDNICLAPELLKFNLSY